jgi:hypothetical protein
MYIAANTESVCPRLRTCVPHTSDNVNGSLGLLRASTPDDLVTLVTVAGYQMQPL